MLIGNRCPKTGCRAGIAALDSSWIDFEPDHGEQASVMLVESDRDYFLRRAEEEQAAGVVAGHVEARQAHIELAWRYRNLADAIEAHQRLYLTDSGQEPGRSET